MKRLLTFLYLLLGFVLVSVTTKAQTAFMNAPDSICAGSFATMNGQIWENSVNVDYMDWSVSPALSASDYEILFNTDGTAADQWLNQNPANGNWPNITAMTIKLNKAGTYTFTVKIFYKDWNNVRRSVTTSKKIKVKDCIITSCPGTISTMAGFFEDFGKFKKGANPRRNRVIDSLVTADGQASTYIFSNTTNNLGDNYYSEYYSTQLRPEWVDAKDHTGNIVNTRDSAGGMLVANSAIEKKAFYKRRINNLCPGSIYTFSAWFMNVNSEQVFSSSCNRATDTKPDGYHYAGVTFILWDPVNKKELQRFNTNDVSMNLARPTWQQYGGSFKTTVTSVDLIIQNNNFGGCGNDIAIDDIEFKYCSPDIFAYVDGLKDEKRIKDIICGGAPLNLNAYLNPKDYFVKPTYQWQVSTDSINFTNLKDGVMNDGTVTGTKDSLIKFTPGALKGDPVMEKVYYFRVNITDEANLQYGKTCEAPSRLVEIKILPQPKITVTGNEICNGQVAKLVASGGYTSYYWKVNPIVNDTILNVSPSVTTTYEVVGTKTYGKDKVCSDSNRAKITVYEKPVVNVKLVTPKSICEGDSARLGIQPENLKFDITWAYNGAVLTGQKKDSITHTPLKVTDSLAVPPVFNRYVVTVTNGKCVISDSTDVVVYSMPVSKAGPDQILCDTASRFRLNANTPLANQSGLWTFKGGINENAVLHNATQPNAYVTGLTSGKTITLVWTVTNTKKPSLPACAAVSELKLTSVAPLPATRDTVIIQCANKVFNIVGIQPGPGATGYWSVAPGSTGITFGDKDAYSTTATLTKTAASITDSVYWNLTNVCGTVKYKVKLIVHPVPTVTVSVPAVCENVDSFVIALGKPTYPVTKYTLSAGTPNVMPGFNAISGTWPSRDTIRVKMPAGVTGGKAYDFVLAIADTANKGCTSTTTFRLQVDSKPDATITGAANICIGNTLTLRVPATSYPVKWSINGVVQTATTGVTLTHKPAVPGRYIYNATIVNGACTSTDSDTINVTAIPVPAPGNDSAQCDNGNFKLNAVLDTAQAGVWSFSNGINNGAVITNPNDPKTTVTGLNAGTSVILVWTVRNITNNTCTAKDSITLTNTRPLTNSTVGPNLVQCGNNKFQLNGSVPAAGETGTWSVAPGTTGVTVSFSNVNAPKAIATVTGTPPVSVTLIWTISNGVCKSDTAQMKLTLNPVPAITAAKADTICTTASIFNLKVSGVSGIVNSYTVDVDPASTRKMSGFVRMQGNWPAVNPADTTLKVNLPAGITPGIYDFIFTVNDGTNAGCAATIKFQLAVTKPSTDPVVATSISSICDKGDVTLTVTGTLGTDPGGTRNATWKWYTGACPGTPGSVPVTPATIVNPDGSKVIFTNVNKTTIFYVRAEGTAPCATTACASVKVEVFQKPDSAKAGKDQFACNQKTPFTLDGNTTGVTGVQGTWTKYNASATIADIHNPKTQVTVLPGDTATFTWTIGNGVCDTTRSSVKITNYATPDKAIVGKDQIHCNDSAFILTGNKPTAFGAVGTWSFPATTGVTISNVNDPAAKVIVPAGLTVPFTWKISNGVCDSTTATIKITNYAVPAVATVGKDQIHCNDSAFILTGNNPGAVGAKGTWSFPATTGVTISNVNDPSAKVIVPAGLTVPFTWKVSNGVCDSTTATIKITNYAVPAKATVGKDQIHCNDSAFILTGNNPGAVGAKGTWSFPVTPGVTISNPNDPSAKVIVPAGLTVPFTWKVSNGVCDSTTATIKITNYAVPAVATVGKDQIHCNDSAFILTGNNPGAVGAKGTWSFPATTGVTISNVNDPSAKVIVPAGLTVPFTWKISNGVCDSTSATIKITNYAVPAVATVGKDQIHCNDSAFILTGNNPGAVGAKGTWSFPVTPGVTISNVNDPSAKVIVPAGLTVSFTWKVSNGVCDSTTATIKLTNYAVPAKATVGKDQIHCNDSAFILTGNNPGAVGAKGTWSFPATTGVTISNVNDPAAKVIVPAGLTVPFTWKISNGVCDSTTATIKITNYAVPAVATVGKDQIHCNDSAFILTGNNPGAVGAKGTWSFPVTTGVTISNVNDPAAKVIVPAGLTVPFTWKVSNGVCDSTTATIKITNYAVPAVATVGKDQIHCNDSAFILTGNNPGAVGAKGTWSFPATTGVTISNVNDPSAKVIVPAGLTVPFTWKVSNGVCDSTTATIKITNYAVPAVATVGKDQIHCNDSAFILTGNNPGAVGAKGTWSFPATTGVTISNVNDPSAKVIVPAGLTVPFTWKISNGVCDSTTATIKITNYAVPAVATVGKDQIHCNDSAFILTGNNPGAVGAKGTWSFPVTPGVTISNVNDPSAKVIVPAGLTVSFTWKVSNGVCDSTTATIKLTNYAVPAKATVGKDQIHCNDSAFILTGNNPGAVGAKGTWSFPATTGVTISNVNDPAAKVIVPAGLTVPFTWKISNGVCDSTIATIKITNYAVPAVATVGKDQIHCNDSAFILTGNNPGAVGAKGTWSFPATTGVTISNVNDPSAKVIVPAGLTVPFTWKVSNGVCDSTSATIKITNYAVPAVATVGKDQIHCNDSAFILTGNNPGAVGAKGTWSFPVTPGVTISNPNDPSAKVIVPAGLTVPFTWKVSNGVCDSTTATIKITNYAVPAVATVGKDQIHCNDSAFILTGNNPGAVGAKGTWSFPATTGVTISNVNDPSAKVIVPAGLTVPFTWKISNGVCDSTTATIKITNYAVPAVATVGKDQIHCNDSAFILTGNNPGAVGAKGTWSFPVTPGVTISNPNDPSAKVIVPAGLTVSFTWKVSNGVCDSTTATIKITNYALPAKATVGKDQIHCNDSAFILTGNNPGAVGAKGTWSFPTTPGVTISNVNDPAAKVIVPAGLTVPFTWKISNGVCDSTTATIKITNYAVPAVATVGKDQIHCNDSAFILTGNNPGAVGAKGTWSFPATTGVTISNVNDPSAKVIVPAGLTVPFTWKVSNGVCDSTSATIKITNYAVPAVATVGKDQIHCNDSAFILTGNNPGAVGAKGTWSFPVTPGVTISNPNDPSAKVIVPAGLTVPFTWKVSNGVCDSTTATIKITNYAVPAVATVGKDQIHCNDSAFILTGNNPGAVGAKGTWSFPATTGVTISNVNDPSAKVIVPAGLTVPFTWKISNGVCDSTTATIKITNYAVPAVATVGKDQIHCNDSAFILTGNNPGAVGAKGTWSFPVTPGVTISNPNDPSAKVIVPAGLTVSFTWKVSNGVCDSTTATIKLTNYALPAKATVGKDQIHCNDSAFILTGNNPGAVGAKGTWSFPATTGVTISNINDPAAKVIVPAGLTVPFTWKISNGVCDSTTATIKITNYAIPAKATVGKDQIHCNDSAFILTGNNPGVVGAKGTWSFPATTGVTISNVNDPSAKVIVPAGLTVPFTWKISNGVCDSTSATIKITNYAVPAKATVGKDQIHCNDSAFILTGNNPGAVGAKGTWSFPATTGVTISNVNDPSAKVIVPAGLTVPFTWKISNGVCDSTSATIKITNYAVPAKATVGKDQIHCNDSAFILTGNNPGAVGAKGTWSFPATTGVTISNVNDPAAKVIVPAGLTVPFTWKVSNGVCDSTTATIKITNYAVPAKATVGKDQIHCNDSAFILTGNNPGAVGAKGTWSFPATTGVTISNVNDPSAKVIVPAGLTVSFTWKVSNGVCDSTTATIKITNYALPAKATVGKDQIHCNDSAFILTGNNPGAVGAKGTWSYPATPGVTISNVNDPSAKVIVPAGLTVPFTWKVSNGVCDSTTATIKITNYAQPDKAIVGKDQIHCNDSAFTLTGNRPIVYGAKGTWSFPATPGVTISNVNDPAAKVIVPAGLTVPFTWKISNGVCDSTTATIKITNYAVPAKATVGKDQIHCNDSAFILTGNNPGAVGAKGTWSFPATTGVTISNVNDPSAKVIVPAGLTVPFTWKVSNGVCDSTTATIKITNYAVPAKATVGKDQIHCNDSAFILTGNNPGAVGAKGTWSFPVTPGVTISNINDPSAKVIVPAGLTVPFTWKVSNGVCDSTTATIKITNYAVPAKATVGKDQIHCNDSAFILTGNNPGAVGAKGTWSYPATPGVTISNINDPSAKVIVPAGLTVPFTWKVSNGVCDSTTATIKITNYAVPAKATVGKDQIHCNDSAFILTGNNPGAVGAKGTWSFPATTGVTISNVNDPSAKVIVPAGLTVPFTWKISNGVCDSTTATIKITNYAMPAKATVGKDQIHCNDSAFILTGNNPGAVGAKGTWSFPATPGVTISDPNNPAAKVIVPAGLTVPFTWKVSNGVCDSTSATIKITNYAVPAKATVGKDQEHCNEPNFILTGNNPGAVGAKGTWSFPATTGVTISNINDPSAKVFVPAGLTVPFTWKVSNGVCDSTSATIKITNYAVAEKANAGPDQKACNQTDDFYMNANKPSVATATGMWKDISRVPGRAKIKSLTNPLTAVTVPVGDTVILQWSIANGVCDSTFSRVTIINYKAAAVAAAGPSQEKCNSSADFIMAANAPGSSSATGTWTDISRIPGRATIKDKNNPQTAVTVPVGDTVILKWTITNGDCISSSSQVTLINYAKASAANAGKDQEACNQLSDFIMHADAPSVSSAKGFWSIIKGTAIIRNINNHQSGVNVEPGDTVTLRWTVTNGTCSATWDDVTLINYKAPVAAYAGPDQEHCNVDTFRMKASSPGVPGAKGVWVITSSNILPVTISNPSDSNALVTVPAGETAQLTWVVSNGKCAATSSSVTLINRKPVLNNIIQANQTVCVTETPAALSSNALSGGNGTYTYQWQQSTAGAGGPFTNINGATNATYQPGLLSADTWYRRIVASGACINNISNVVKITVVIKAPFTTFIPDPVTTECVSGKDYTTLFGKPVFSHAPYDDVLLNVTYNDVTVVTSPCLTTITRTWTAIDKCGLTATASQTITVTDTKAPVFTTAAPADITVDCDKVPAKTDLTAKDDCAGLITIPVVETRKDIPGACGNNYQLIRTWTAKDYCNTGVTLTQIITVKDMSAPVFTMQPPADATVNCDNIPSGINLTASDNCTPGVITVIPRDSIVRNPKLCANNYIIFRKWTALDECGNGNTVQQIIRVQDTTRPVFSMPAPADVTVDCDKVPAWPNITATDNCSGNVQVMTSSKTQKLPGSKCAASYLEIRTWTATDECGNKATMQQTITVQDTTRPVFTVLPPADTTVNCDDIPKPATDVTATDNCSTPGNGLSIIRQTTTETIPGACGNTYRIIRTWTATDACDNKAVIRQVITVTDTTRPVIMPAPADVTIYCQDKIPAPPVLSATDNCDPSFPKKAIYSEDPFVKDICNGYTIIRRWTIMDACGNKANDVIQRVIIMPCPKPQLEATLPVNCSDNPRIALQPVGNISMPSFTLVAVTPSNAVTGLPITQNSNQFNLNGATSASFIITDGKTGCSSDTMTYKLNYIQQPMVNLGKDTTICGGNSLVLDAGATNFAYTIRWSTGETTQRIKITEAGTYWVSVSNGQCITTDTIKVGLIPTPLVTIPDTTICRGQSVKLDAYVDGATYLWSNGATTPSILVSTQEEFWVKVMKSACITIDTVKVSVNPPPDISLSRDTAICPDQSIMLTVNSNGGRIQWQTGETGNSIVVNKPGGYWVAVSRDNCVVRDTVNVRLKPGITLDLGPDRNICPDGTVTFDGSNPDAISYLWNDGDTNPVKRVTQAGKYKLAVMDRFCQRVILDSVRVNITGVPKINLGNDTVMCKGETLTLRAEGGGITGVRWDNGQSGPTLQVTNGGTYTVTVFNDCGSATDAITVNFTACEPKPQFPNVFSPNGDGRNDFFRPIVRGPMFEYELRIFNRWGELIFISSDSHRGWDGKYKGVPVDVGTYVWWLTYKKSAGGASNVIKGEVTVIR
ncbi:gliding motility-associated C-terminal domain-containing protein [Chitinophaga sp. Mgbs1]|uniref:Gliding motility-associated C-terminal domain-containing protein n=1 Tax=Chitinophaga solisilvae TaxID=1233460 RepID=A0A9Q5GSJ2_9BACT|nr:gliding motility-associated C-terminal domain-containing protein [Chitinophaga solisilvae]